MDALAGAALTRAGCSDFPVGGGAPLVVVILTSFLLAGSFVLLVVLLMGRLTPFPVVVVEVEVEGVALAGD